MYAGSAFLIWGLSPVYWKALNAVPALEITMHRVVWSFVFLICLILLQRRRHEFVEVFKNGRMLLTLISTAIIISGNWLLYIWAVNNNYLLQASLGYYINPLVNVVLGMVFLREQLRKPQILAVLLAAGGVLCLTMSYGEFPWIAFTLALSFGFYGLIRKVAPVGPLVGLAVETMLLSPPAVAYLVYLNKDLNGLRFEGPVRGAALDLAAGLNLVSLPAADQAFEYSSYEMLQGLGDESQVSSIRRYETTQGWQTTSWFMGSPSGAEYSTRRGEGYLIYMKEEKLSWRPY